MQELLTEVLRGMTGEVNTQRGMQTRGSESARQRKELNHAAHTRLPADIGAQQSIGSDSSSPVSSLKAERAAAVTYQRFLNRRRARYRHTNRTQLATTQLAPSVQYLQAADPSTSIAAAVLSCRQRVSANNSSETIRGGRAGKG